MLKTPLLVHICLPLLLLALGSAAHAELFKWVDEKGVTHYGDRIPPEYSKQGNSQLDKRGVTVRKTDPALTAEQRRAQQEEGQRLKEALKQAEEQQRQDIALVNTYASEEEIDFARDRRVAQIDQIILQAQHQDSELAKRTAVVEKEFKAAKSASAKAVAQGDLANLAKQRTAMQAAIAKLTTDKQEVIDTFGADKLRYREIKTSGITSTRLSAVARRGGDERVTELAVATSEQIVTDCVNQWRDTTGRLGTPYAVAARLLARANREELIVEGRARSSSGQSQVRRWTCVLTSDRKINVKETDVRKALASLGAQY